MKFLLVVVSLLGGTVPAIAQELSDAEKLERLRVISGYQLASDPENRDLRFLHAQLSYQTGNYEAAKHHLRSLMRGSESEDVLRELKLGYATVVAEAPWSFGASFSILPSTNIGRSSSSEIFQTPFGTFLITDGGQEESGVGYRIGGSVAYETVLASGHFLGFGAELTRSQYPADRLDRFDGRLSAALTSQGLRGVFRVSPFVARSYFDGDRDGGADATRVGASASYEWYASRVSSLTYSATVEDRDYLSQDHLDGPFLSGSLVWRDVLGRDLSWRVGVSVDRHRPDSDHLRSFAATVSTELTRPLDGIGVVGLEASLGGTHFDGEFPVVGYSREDSGGSLGLSFRSSRISVWSISPRLLCRYQVNTSNVALYDFKSTDCAISFDRSF